MVEKSLVPRSPLEGDGNMGSRERQGGVVAGKGAVARLKPGGAGER